MKGLTNTDRLLKNILNQVLGVLKTGHVWNVQFKSNYLTIFRASWASYFIVTAMSIWRSGIVVGVRSKARGNVVIRAIVVNTGSKPWARSLIVNYYSTNCNTIQIWAWCSRYLSSVGNRYPAIYVASRVLNVTTVPFEIKFTRPFWLHAHETFNVKSLLRTSQSAMSRATQGILMYPNMY